MIKAFYSDPHFFHRRIIELSGRPFRDARHMTQELVRRYNANVDRYDTVVWVGDAFFCGVDKASDVLSTMNGSKLLVMGNHDGSKTKAACIGFDAVFDELEMRIGDRQVLVSHYPPAGADARHDARYLNRRPKRVKGRSIIHGHTHSTNRGDRGAVNVCVEAWDYYPALVSDVRKILEGGQV